MHTKTVCTHCGLTTYRIDPAQLKAFVRTIHSPKLQQMGNEIAMMKAGYLLHSMSDPEVVIHITLCKPISVRSCSKRPLVHIQSGLSFLEEAKSFLREAPGLESFRIVPLLEYK